MSQKCPPRWGDRPDQCKRFESNLVVDMLPGSCVNLSPLLYSRYSPEILKKRLHYYTPSVRATASLGRSSPLFPVLQLPRSSIVPVKLYCSSKTRQTSEKHQIRSGGILTRFTADRPRSRKSSTWKRQKLVVFWPFLRGHRPTRASRLKNIRFSKRVMTIFFGRFGPDGDSSGRWLSESFIAKILPYKRLSAKIGAFRVIFAWQAWLRTVFLTWFWNCDFFVKTSFSNRISRLVG